MTRPSVNYERESIIAAEIIGLLVAACYVRNARYKIRGWKSRVKKRAAQEGSKESTNGARRGGAEGGDEKKKNEGMII